MKRPLLVFVAAWILFSICPPFTSFDSYWTVPTALSILERRDTDIDEFVPQMPVPARYAVECVPAGRPAVPYLDQPAACSAGHAYSFYPIAVSILILPLVVALKLIVALMPVPSLDIASHPVIAAFLNGDFYAGHAVVEMLCAAFICALAVVVMERLLSEFLPSRVSMLFTAGFALGTGLWSTASRSLYQHGPLQLMLCLTLLLLVRRRIALAALPLAAAYTMRPTGALWVVVITAYVAVHHREKLLRFIAWSLPVAVPFLAYNIAVRHSLLPSYYTMSKAISPVSYGEGLAMHLLSPARGLFVFSPFLLASLVGCYFAFRKKWMFPLTPYLLAGFLMYGIVCGAWWPGHSYGSRYLNDTAPVLMLFLVPAYQFWAESAAPRRRTAAIAFGALLIFSIFVHAHGATSAAAQQWNIFPTNVDQQPHRVWDWRDPQFLRF